jgi:hypothetical protein
LGERRGCPYTLCKENIIVKGGKKLWLEHISLRKGNVQKNMDSEKE